VHNLMVAGWQRRRRGSLPVKQRCYHGALGSRFHGPNPLLPPLAPPWTNAEGGARAEYGEEEGDAREDDGEEEQGVGVARCPAPGLLPSAAAAARRTAAVEQEVNDIFI